MNLNTAWLDSPFFPAFSEMTEPRYLYVYNAETKVSRWTADAVDYFDLPDEYVDRVDEIWAEKVHPDDREAFYQALQSIHAREKSSFHLQHRVMNKKGYYVICSCQGQVVYGDRERPDLFVGSIDSHGITDNVDAITQLYNIYEFRRALNLINSVRQSAMVMTVGINQFSQVNGAYGYIFGNKVLRAFGKMLKDVVGDQGVVYRMDGARFSLCLPRKTEEEAQRLYVLIRQQARNTIQVEGKYIPLGVSGGAVTLEENNEPDACIRANVTLAQQTSKRQCHSELVFYRPDESGCTAVEQCRRNETIRRCVLDGCKGFYLCYQPLVNARTGYIKGGEALLRWHSDTYGDLGPGEFIQWLERDDCFFELGNWIFRQAMTDALPIVQERPEFLLSVNVAYSQLDHSAFVDCLMDIISQTGFPPENLYIELTERERPMDIERLRHTLDHLRAKGIKIALDDFGTGSASLNLLRLLPINRLKIDRQFVAHIQASRTDEVIVESVIDSAKKLGISVCMEGIETQQLRDYVQKYNVDTHQGFFYSRPVEKDDFSALIGCAKDRAG